MSSTGVAFAQGVAGGLSFTLLFLPSGNLVARGMNLAGFRSCSREQRLLWSVCLSVPLAIEACTGFARLLPEAGVISSLVLLAVCGAGVAFACNRRWLPAAPTAWVVLLAGLALGLYVVLAVIDLDFGHRLYVSTVLYDWSVRVPMVAAAMRSGVPPVNGLGALGGHPAALRYFYFWYVVCADVARIAHIPARASLTASCVYAVWALLAAFWLALRNLLGVRRNLRGHAALSFLVLSVLGLDLVPTLPLLLSAKLHPYPEIEWWHQDRTPSLLSSCLYAPHHIAAFACLLTGLLVIALTMQGQETGSEQELSLWIAAPIAGVCFAAAAGTSILPTLIVAIACLVWVVDLVLQRRFRTVGALAGSAITALLLARSFLHELQTNDAAASGALATLRWRNWDFVRMYQAKYHLMTHPAALSWAVAVAGVLTIHVLDLGFYLFVLIHQVRKDSRRTLSAGERAMWAIFVGTAIPYLFLSSASIASPNDLGVDAGLLLRLLLQMWAVVWVYELWTAWKAGRKPWREGSWIREVGFALAGCCFALGLAGEMFQVVWERVYFPLVGSQTLRKQMDVLTTDRLSERLYNIREAYRSLDRVPQVDGTPTAIQYNPISPMQPALTFYATRQIAAFDIGCGTGYGGSLRACRAVMPGLLRLYGNTEGGFARGRAGNDRQDGAATAIATKADAEAVCRELHLWALVAESTDSIWAKPQSWVWTMPLMVDENSTVRIVRCPNQFDDGSIDDNDPE